MVALMLSAGALAGCNKDEPKPDPEPEHTHTFSTEWTSDETNHWHASTCGHDVKDGEGAHTFGTDGKCSVCEYYDASHDDAKIFTDEKLGAFKGVFYNGDLVFTISKDGVVVLDGDQTYNLENNTISGSGYSTVATYKGPQDASFTLKWKEAEWDLNDLDLMLPTLISGENELQLQPAVDQAQGWYDGWDGYMESGTQIYIVTNDFNVEKDAFQMYTANFSYGYLTLGVYLRSSFVKIGDKLELALSWFDEYDIEDGFNYLDWNYYLVKGEDGRLVLADIGPKEVVAEWWTRPTFFMGEFIRPSSKDIPLGTIFGDWEYDSYTFWADEDAKTVSINWGEDLEYVEGYDEYGAYVLVDGAKYRGTSYGISVETAEGVEECPYFVFYDFSNLQWYSYISGNNSIAFVLGYDDETWESEGHIEIDGVKADDSYLTFIDNMVAIGAKVGQDEYFMMPYDGTDAVLVGKNEDASIYVNSNKLYDFVGSFFDEEFTVLTVAEKEGNLTVKFKGLEFDASLVYSEDYGIVVSFDEDGIIAPLNAEKNLFVAFFGETSFVFLFEKNSVLNALGEWTSGLIDATFNNDLSVVFAGLDMNMLGLIALQSSMGDFAPGCVFGTQDVQFVAMIDDVCTYIYELGEQGELNYISSFIRPEVFANFFGEFNYMGEYGKEKVSLSEEGVLTVTTMNEEKTGIVDIEYVYDPFAYLDYYGDVTAGLTFYSNDIPVNIMYDGEGHCSIFNIVYLAKVFFDNQGLYGSSAESNLYVVDNKVVYNGEKMAITALGTDSISGTFGGKEAVVTFASGNVTVIVNGEDPVVLAKNATKVSSFACEVKENVGELNEDIQVTSDGKILIRDTGSEGEWTQVTDYDFAIDAEGNVSIKFVWKVAYTFTIAINDGSVVITGESSLLPPPLPF